MPGALELGLDPVDLLAFEILATWMNLITASVKLDYNL